MKPRVASLMSKGRSLGKKTSDGSRRLADAWRLGQTVQDNTKTHYFSKCCSKPCLRGSFLTKHDAERVTAILLKTRPFILPWFYMSYCSANTAIAMTSNHDTTLCKACLVGHIGDWAMRSETQNGTLAPFRVLTCWTWTFWFSACLEWILYIINS